MSAYDPSLPWPVLSFSSLLPSLLISETGDLNGYLRCFLTLVIFFSILYFNMGLIYLVSNKGNTGEMVMQVRDRNSKQVLLLTDFFFLLKLTLAPNLLKSIKNKQA